MSIQENYGSIFLPRYNNFPQGKYITVLIVREIESEAIFRTEGSGEPLNTEFVFAGTTGGAIIPRVVISKRKQTAVERRTGRDLLRSFSLLKASKGKKKAAKGAAEASAESGECALNRNEPCEQCMDCMIYGFAAGGGGAQRSRVVTDDAFSLHAASRVVDRRQFNALFDNSTMRDPITKEASTSIGTDEYVKPGTLFLDMETLRDLTYEEFIYAFGNILRSSRYGAISSRIGKVRNVIAGIIFSDCEVFSNLELTQHVYEVLKGENEEPDFPVRARDVAEIAHQQSERLCQSLAGRCRILAPREVQAVVDEVTALYQDEDQLKALLEHATAMYG